MDSKNPDAFLRGQGAEFLAGLFVPEQCLGSAISASPRDQVNTDLAQIQEIWGIEDLED